MRKKIAVVLAALALVAGTATAAYAAQEPYVVAGPVCC